MKNPFDVLEQNSLNFKLTPISFREVFFIAETPCDVYAQVDGLFKIVNAPILVGEENADDDE